MTVLSLAAFTASVRVIAEFPVTDPANQDAQNLQAMAKDLLKSLETPNGTQPGTVDVCPAALRRRASDLDGQIAWYVATDTKPLLVDLVPILYGASNEIERLYLEVERLKLLVAMKK